MGFELFIGLRYFKAKRKNNFISLITLLSIGGVTLGVMALIIVISVINGFEEKMKEKILGVNSHIVFLKQDGLNAIREYRELMNILKGIKGVKETNPFVYFQAMLSSKKKASGVFVRGVLPSYVRQIEKFAVIKGDIKGLDFNKNPETKVTQQYRGINPPLSPFAKEGDSLNPPLGKGDTGGFLKEEDLRDIPAQQKGFKENGKRDGQISGIIIGHELAGRLGVGLNDYVTLIVPRLGGKSKGAQAGLERLKISGIFDSGMYEYDLNLAYVSLGKAQDILGIDDAVSGIEIRVFDPYNSGKIAQKIRGKLKFPYYLRDWKEMNRNLFQALWIQKLVLFVIIMLIIIVAAFNIISTMIMVVIEKTKEIAILRSIGATRNSVKKLFIFQGAIIGIVGTVLGNLGGYLSCLILKKYQFIKIDYTIYYIKTLPVIMNPSTFLIISVYSLAICFLFTFFPAWQASRLNITEALRYE
ncbi:MAG: hypothetical protein A2042_03030 [Candidatus Schekmanbacteria bacterium GWA2_38_11]|uniref:ABC transporter permease n=1 Tax=Candidatus Schekmanbacteria bacterium GWA2_38_11 TaxID=1817876 RepID=A0A1F7RLR2_9BACT|nr:MAG: hypothetical protein A2042_03030 [Candidatus Schekmanbacteria bacterium GWA2_38_11]